MEEPKPGVLRIRAVMPGWDGIWVSPERVSYAPATRLTLDQAQRLTDEHLGRTYRVLTEDPPSPAEPEPDTPHVVE